MKLITKNSPHCALCIDYTGKYIEETINTKFLGLQIDNHLTWKNHIDQMVPKLSGACYAVRSMYHISNINTLKSIYFAYINSIIKHRINFWGNSSNSKKIFTLQKKIIRIMVGAQPRTPRRSLFKKLEILPIPCQYIFSLMNFILKNQENFQTNSSIHSIDTRNKHHLHRPNANLSCLKKSTFYAGIRIFNRLPLSLTSL
jgi:IS1 family transposase